MRAGVIEPPKRGGGRFASESILVFRGPWKSDLKIFDQGGDEIGAARRSGDEYELRDAEPLCRVVKSRDSRHRLYFEFSVLGSDGMEIGTIVRERTKRVRGCDTMGAMTNVPSALPSDAAVGEAFAGEKPNDGSDPLRVMLKRRDSRAIATLRYGQRREVIRGPAVRIVPPRWRGRLREA